MKRIGRALSRPDVLVAIGLTMLAVVIWFVGPLVSFGGWAPLADIATRLALLLVLALGFSLAVILIRARRTSEEEAMLAALRQKAREEEDRTQRQDRSVEEQFAAFRDELRATLKVLGQGHRNLLVSARYSVPWYLIVGGEGVGKTSIVQAAGLNLQQDLPAASSNPAGHVHVSEQAVFIELPRRTAFDMSRAGDTLLKMVLDHLHKLRSQQPINGILVVTSVDELTGLNEEDLEQYAVTIRKRLDVATASLKTFAPVYLLVNKLDLVVGFEEFFEGSSAEERASVLGIAAQRLREQAPGAEASSFAGGFRATVERFAQKQFVRLQDEPDERRRRRLFEFTVQFAALQSRINLMLEQILATHRFTETPDLRGVFFTSARQSGAFEDVLGPMLAAGFGQGTGGLALPQDENFQRGRPFFVKVLFQQVVFAEASLSGLTKPAALAMRLKSLAGSGAVVAGALGVLAFWWLSFGEGRAYMARIDRNVDLTRASISKAAPDGRMPTDFAPVLAVLDNLRRLAADEPKRATLGLYQTAPVRSAAEEAYDSALSNLFFPFVWAYLSDGLDNPRTPAALRFQQLKLYLMLTGTRPVASETAGLLGADFAANWLVYDRSDAVDRQIAEHFASLADAAVKAPPADPALIARARALISNYTLARLAYDMVLASPQVTALPAWRPVDNMSLSGPQALSRISGKSFFDGIPGVFTRAGVHDVIRSAAGGAAREIATDAWVMGTDVGLVERERMSARIRDGLLDLYRVDYIAHWDSLLADLGMMGRTADELARSIAIIVGKPSPLGELFAAIARETDLDAESTTVADALPGAQKAALVTGSILANDSSRNLAIQISDHYRSFRAAVTAPDGQPAPVNGMFDAMDPLYRMLNHIATGGDVLELGVEPQTVLDQLYTKNSIQPQPLQPVFARIFTQAAAITGGTSRERISAIWRTTVLPLCRTTLTGRYPFNPKSGNDASLEDFARLFGPKGSIATFRDSYLKPFIDTTERPWRWKKASQIGLGYDDTVLASLERADDIRNTYFGDGDTPNLNFSAMAAKLDMRARAFMLDLGGTPLLYNHGPVLKTDFKWPPDKPEAGASMSMMPELEGQRNGLSRQGPWALFRLFALGRRLEKNPSDTVTYQFSIGNRSVLVRLTVPPTRNPFARDSAANFTCPEL
jgi:type VI secretion system protein ImpL